MADLNVLSNGFPTLSPASLMLSPAGGAGGDAMSGDGGTTAFLDMMTGQTGDLALPPQSVSGQDPASTGKGLPIDAGIAAPGATVDLDPDASTSGAMGAAEADPSLAWLMGASGGPGALLPTDRAPLQPSLLAMAAVLTANPALGQAPETVVPQADTSPPATVADAVLTRIPAAAPDLAVATEGNDAIATKPAFSGSSTVADAEMARPAWLRGLQTRSETVPTIALPSKSSDDDASTDATAQDTSTDDAHDATRDPALACLLAVPTQPVAAQALPGLPIISRAAGTERPVGDVTATAGAQAAPVPAGESRSGPSIPGAGHVIATPPADQAPGTAAALAIDPAPTATSTPAPATPGMTTDATGAAAPADAVPQSSDGARARADASLAARAGLATVTPEANQRGTTAAIGRNTAAQPAIFALAGGRRTQTEAATEAGSPAAATLLQPADTAQMVTKPADAQQPSLDMAQSDWPQKMIDHIETLRDAANASDTSIRLKPEALGRIDVAIRDSGDGALSVRFTAEQPATRALLADAQPQLTAAAVERGIRLSGTSVDLAGSGMAGGQDRPRPQTPNGSTANGNTRNHLASGGDDIAVDDDGRIA